MNLRWSHSDAVITDAIPPGMGKHCDLGSIGKRAPNETGVTADNAVLLKLSLKSPPFIGGHELTAGAYELVLQVGATNSRPIVKTIRITLSGRWSVDVNAMFTQHAQFSLGN